MAFKLPGRGLVFWPVERKTVIARPLWSILRPTYRLT